MTQRRTVTASVTVCGGKIYLQDSFCSLVHYKANASGSQSQMTPGHSYAQSCQPTPHKHSSGAASAGIVENFAVCMSNSPSEILLNIHIAFLPTGTSAKKRKHQATTEADSEATSSSSSDSLSTMDTSSSELEDKKDFIIPDYPSEELMSSDSSDSEPEDATAENLSMGWSEKVR